MTSTISGPDFSLRGRIRPEPRTEEERIAGESIDLVSFQILSTRLELIAVEGKEVMIQTGSSLPLVAEDMNAGIYTAAGDMACSSTGVYFHSVTGQLPIKYVLRHWMHDATVGVKDGDVFYCTDPIYGGTHTADQIAFVPIFFEEELIGWSAAVAHQADVGAPAVGIPAAARGRFMDGMRLPPMKIGSDFQLHSDLLSALAQMTRTPESVMLDIRARVATCMRIRERILELCEELGADRVRGLLRRVIAEHSDQAKAKFATYNDGIFRATTFYDDTGDEVGLLRIDAELEKRGEKIIVRVDASPETLGSINAYVTLTQAAIANPLFKFVLSDVPASIGIMDAIEFEIPEGTLFSASPDAGVAASLQPLFALESCFQICIAKMAFDSADREQLAAPQDPVAYGAYYVSTDRYGRVDSMLDTTCNGSGGGARASLDGVDVMAPPWALYADILDTEMLEASGQLMFMYRRFSVDNHGFGKFRGGASPDAALLAHDPWGGEASLVGGTLGMASKFPLPAGLFGGYGGACLPGVFVRGSNVKQLMHDGTKLPASGREMLDANDITGGLEVTKPHQDEIQMREGDVVLRAAGGGGGYGDVLDREPSMVVADVERGVLSRTAAARVYGVAVDEYGAADETATESLRAEIMRQRRELSMDFAEFEAEWSTRRPPEDALFAFGEWPR